MDIPFYKYHGTGNDFIMIDNRSNPIKPSSSLISSLCDRRFGIGADGLILIENHNDADFDMTYFNADGSQSLCANGSRCAVSFARFLGLINDKTYFQTISGKLKAIIDGDQVRLKMNDQPIPQDNDTFTFLNNGSPHHIEFVDAIAVFNVFERGQEVRYSKQYDPDGTNVNFIELLDGDSIYVRTYERGVEDETLSCGTGVVASALTAVAKGLKSPITINTKGGELEVIFEQTIAGDFTDVWLIGPAQQVYKGIIQGLPD